MPRTVKARPDQLRYERLDGETAKAFRAFVIFRDLGADRTLEGVRVALSKPSGYYRQIQRWASTYAWTERAALYDDWIDRMRRQEMESSIPLWESRRQDALRHNLELCARLRQRVEAMMEFPLVKERVESRSDGRTTVYVIPAGWSWGSIISMIRACCELEAQTISEGLLDEEAAAFDVHTATLDDCRSYIDRQRKRTKAQPGTE
jgi:hypothetical protein